MLIKALKSTAIRRDVRFMKEDFTYRDVKSLKEGETLEVESTEVDMAGFEKSISFFYEDSFWLGEEKDLELVT